MTIPDDAKLLAESVTFTPSGKVAPNRILKVCQTFQAFEYIVPATHDYLFFSPPCVLHFLLLPLPSRPLDSA